MKLLPIENSKNNRRSWYERHRQWRRLMTMLTHRQHMTKDTPGCKVSHEVTEVHATSSWDKGVLLLVLFHALRHTSKPKLLLLLMFFFSE